ADVRIYRLPIIKSPLKDRAAHATKQCSGNSFNESIAVSIVEDFAHQGAGLAEIIVVGSQRVSTAHHAAIRLPAFGDDAGLIRPGATTTIGRINWRITTVVVRHLAIKEIGVNRHFRLIDRQLMKVGSDPVALGIGISKGPAQQHFIWRQSYAWYGISRR